MTSIFAPSLRRTRALERRSSRAVDGRVISVVGPDGTGKSTLCDALRGGILEDLPLLFLANRRGADSPGMLPHRKVRGSTREPHRHPPHPWPASLLKTLYLLAEHLLVWVIRIRPFVRRGGWVMIERGWWDTLVDPRRYRLQDHPHIGAVLGRLVPKTDLVVVLEASPEVIRIRKPQLTSEELERQLAAWHTVLPSRQTVAYLDAARPAVSVLTAVIRHLTTLVTLPELEGPSPTAPTINVLSRPLLRTPEGASSVSVQAAMVGLLHRVTEVCPELVVWKNADAALGGRGDLDVVAPTRCWAGIEEAFRRWAEALGLGSVVCCRHMPGSMFLVARDTATGRLFELDVKGHLAHRGAILAEAEDLASLAETDRRGFRRLRAGAEALLKLAIHGIGRTGRPLGERLLRERVSDLLRIDAPGGRQATELLGGARRSMQALVGAVTGERWSRLDAVVVESWCRLRAAGRPGVLLARARFRLTSPCPGLKTALKDGGVRPGEIPPDHEPIISVRNGLG